LGYFAWKLFSVQSDKSGGGDPIGANNYYETPKVGNDSRTKGESQEKALICISAKIPSLSFWQGGFHNITNFTLHFSKVLLYNDFEIFSEVFRNYLIISPTPRRAPTDQQQNRCFRQ
jgi:hypothetical protein